MTALADRPSRDALGIDTVARGIAYASHLLKSVLTTGVIDFSYTLSLVDNEPRGVLNIRATIDYDPVAHFASGSDYLEGVLSLSTDTPTELFSPILPAIGGVPIPIDDSRVTNLESYLVWLILLHIDNQLTLLTPNVNAVRISQGLTPQRFYKTFTLNLDYDPIEYATTGNIIAAINPGTDVVSGGSIFNNNTIINNTLLIGNV